jgi:hypothetical protein
MQDAPIQTTVLGAEQEGVSAAGEKDA